MVVKCPVFGCEDSEKEFKTEAGLKSHIRNKHPEWVGEGVAPREVPIVEEDFTTAELVRGRHMDIEKAPSYGVLAKSALR